MPRLILAQKSVGLRDEALIDVMFTEVMSYNVLIEDAGLVAAIIG